MVGFKSLPCSLIVASMVIDLLQETASELSRPASFNEALQVTLASTPSRRAVTNHADLMAPWLLNRPLEFDALHEPLKSGVFLWTTSCSAR